jgi:hypothetical protein
MCGAASHTLVAFARTAVIQAPKIHFRFITLLLFA